MNNLGEWLFFFIPALFVIFWIAVLNLVARAFGWSRLAKEYRYALRFDGVKKRFCSGELAGGPFLGLPSNYGLCLTTGSNPQGLYLAVQAPFRPGHPPVLIPWSDIKPKVERRWYGDSIVFNFERVAPVRLRLASRLARQLVANAGTTEIEPIDQPA
jgi:hypothetical protein